MRLVPAHFPFGPRGSSFRNSTSMGTSRTTERFLMASGPMREETRGVGVHAGEPPTIVPKAPLEAVLRQLIPLTCVAHVPRDVEPHEGVMRFAQGEYFLALRGSEWVKRGG